MSVELVIARANRYRIGWVAHNGDSRLKEPRSAAISKDDGRNIGVLM
ncbi:hypothetical protein [Synechococcus sp. MIT S1220]